MEFQEVISLIQTFVAIASLLVSLITLNKVTQINKVKKNKSNSQIALGTKNKQKIENKD